MFLGAYERLETSPAISIAEFAQVEICFFFFGLRTMKIGRPLCQSINYLFSRSKRNIRNGRERAREKKWNKTNKFDLQNKPSLRAGSNIVALIDVCLQMLRSIHSFASAMSINVFPTTLGTHEMNSRMEKNWETEDEKKHPNRFTKYTTSSREHRISRKNQIALTNNEFQFFFVVVVVVALIASAYRSVHFEHSKWKWEP